MQPEPARMRRIRAFVALGLLVVIWLVARPFILAAAPVTRLVEFPVAVLLTALLCWRAMRPARVRERPEAPWRRHEQVVRALDDPEIAPLQARLDAWVETGAHLDEASDVLARAHTSDDAQRVAMRDRLVVEMTAASSRRKREALLRNLATTPLLPLEPTGA